MMHPLIGEFPVTQVFGVNPDAYAGYGLEGHNGVDYGTPMNTPVYAESVGVVVRTGFDADGYGIYVKIHYTAGYTAIYAHLGCRLTYTDSHVESGQIIGRTGSTGNSTGPHLHYEIRPDGEPTTNGYNGAVDPVQFWERLEQEPRPTLRPGQVLHVPESYTLNLRAGPGVEFPVLGTLAGGAPVEVMQERGDWVLGKLQAWVHRDYLEA